MKSNIDNLQPNSFYHIYNRGINGENIFKSTENYYYFLNKYSKFIPSVADTYAYCLLKNHFHFLIKTRSENEINENIKRTKQLSVQMIISTQFSHFFNGYVQGFNKSLQRTGSLLETPFRRKEIKTESYLRHLVFYIHFNPEKHRLYSDFKTYSFSSYRSLLSEKETQLNRDEVLHWFGNKENFISFHSDLSNLSEDIFEFE